MISVKTDKHWGGLQIGPFEGDALTFEVENGDKGPSAVNLQKA